MEQGHRWARAHESRVRACLLTTALLAAAAAGSSHGWATEPKIKFNIPAGSAPHTLVEYSRQTHLQVLFLDTAVIEHLKTRAVVGEFDPAEALARMLRGTPLHFDLMDDRVTVHGPAELNRPSPSMAAVEKGSRSTHSSWSTTAEPD